MQKNIILVALVFEIILTSAIELGLKPIVVVNKVDKENCTPEIVL